ncbi:MAG: NAD(P)(+) transhydrogenase (Re/Si-specific) subunit alpha, partial [Desulfofustis sp.]|nr:NAD(P)(+) transhydrogenase (Re/Si-specific) subunit alpha [Desulfofustis sp.]
MQIGVPKEVWPGEKRVATTPDVVRLLIKLGYDVAIESGAGVPAAFSDGAYVEAGAEILADAPELYRKSDIILKVRPPQGDVSQG